MSTLQGTDPASTFHKVVLYDDSQPFSGGKNIPYYSGVGENASYVVRQEGAILDREPGVLIDLTPVSPSTRPYPIGNASKGVYLKSRKIFNGTNYQNVGYNITGDGLTHSYLIHFYMTGRFFDTAPESQTNRFWIQPTFNGEYDSGMKGPGGIEVFGKNNRSYPIPGYDANRDPEPNDINKARIISHSIHYIYATNSESWNLDFLLTSQIPGGGDQADGFRFDRAWFTVKTIS